MNSMTIRVVGDKVQITSSAPAAIQKKMLTLASKQLGLDAKAEEAKAVDAQKVLDKINGTKPAKKVKAEGKTDNKKSDKTPA